MPDISMCSNKKCPNAKTCYRINAHPDHYQSYSEFKADKDGHCDYYWEMKPTIEKPVDDVQLRQKLQQLKKNMLAGDILPKGRK